MKNKGVGEGGLKRGGALNNFFPLKKRGWGAYLGGEGGGAS